MFGWKRQRKEDATCPTDTSVDSAAACRHSDLAVECTALACSPAGVVGAAHSLLPAASAASSLCSEDEAGDPCTPSRHCASSSSGGHSIELTALPGSLELQQAGGTTLAHQQGVRAKAAYFEALIRCNTTTHVQCSLDGGECSSQPCYLQEGAAAAGGDVAMWGADGQAACLAGGLGAEGEGDSWGECSEVHMVLRLPRQVALGSSKYGGVADMEALIERLQGALLESEQQRKAAVDAYTRRTGECDNLMRVVRELTESRSKAVSQRASLAERYSELQQEYHRMLRIADLSRTVSKENMAKTSRTRSELRQVQLELHATKSAAQHLTEKHKKMREKVQLLERLDFEEVQESECKKHFTRYRLAETY